MFAFVAGVSSVKAAFEIPRSYVVDVVEPSTNKTYQLFIKLPRSYKNEPMRKYPVIYLTDALYTFQVVSGSTRFPMNSGHMQEAIIVGVSYAKGVSGLANRVFDYTPVKAKDWKLETGNADGYMDFLRTVVFPYINQKYRTNTSDRTYVGNSLGGLLGAYILLTEPDMFSSYVIGSPSVWFNNDYILSLKPKPSDQPIKVYLSVGELETPEHGEKENMVAGATALAKNLSNFENSKLNLKFFIINEADHTTSFPTTAIQGLNWIYGTK